MGILDELKQSANLKVYHDARRGSLLDYSGNGFTLTPAGSGHRFIRTAKGMAFTGTSATALSATGGQTSLDLTTATLFYSVVMYTSNFPVPLPLIVSKANGASLKSGYTAYLSTNFNFALGDNVGFQAFSASSVAPYVGIPVMVAHSWNGTNIVSYINGSQVDLRAQTNIPSPLNMTYQIGSMTNGISRVAVLCGGMANIVLTGAEVARLYDDFLAEGPSPDLIRRNFVQVPSCYGARDADYFSSTTIIADGDMEAVGTASWSAFNASLSKVANPRPGSPGTKCLQIDWAAGVTSEAMQTTIYKAGAVYRVVGWARSVDGTSIPIVDSGGGVGWLGAASTSWQYFDVQIIAIGTTFAIGGVSMAAGRAVQFDDVQVLPLTCCLDTDFVRGPDGKIRDNGPNNYAGTVTGVPVPLVDGIGQSFGVADYVSFGDVVQLNSVAAFTLEQVISLPSGNIPSSYLMRKVSDATHQLASRIATAPATTQPLYTYVSNGGDSYGNTTATVLRASTTQHIMQAYNGGAGSDATRLIVMVDGEQYTLAFSAAGIPASTANLAAAPLYEGYSSTPTPHGATLRRVYTNTLTPAQMRQAYLKNFAQKILLRETFEDVPVSLGVSATAGMYIGQWRVISGSAQVTETSDGKRWLEAISTPTVIATPQPNSFGTFCLTMQRASSPSGNFVTMLQAANPVAYNAANSNGYGFFWAATGQAFLARVTAGAAAAYMTITNAGYLAAATSYLFAFQRRPSDGRWTTTIKGGAFSAYTLMSAAGGGANPSAAESTYTTSSWLVIYMGANDKLLLWDPQNITETGCGLTVFQGQLDPAAGELP